MYVEWYPPNGDPVIRAQSGTNMTLLTIGGCSSTRGAPTTQRGPGQIGSTAIDLITNERVIPLTLALVATDLTDLLATQDRLVRAFARVNERDPLTGRDRPKLGWLYYYRDGLPTVRIGAIARDSPQMQFKGPLGALADIELLAPNPEFEDLNEQVYRLNVGGGYNWPVRFPLTMPSYNARVDLTNSGHVPTPILARLYGDVTTPRLRNLTTGQVLEIQGSIASGSYVEVDTSWGAKRVTLVDSLGTRVNLMRQLSLSRADFWQLQPGLNTISFDADVNLSGLATITWRQRYAGV